MLDLKTSLQMAAHWIWEQRAAAKVTGMSFGEETISQVVLLNLAVHHPQQIKLFPFTKREEGKFGADWEWCFYDRAQTKFQRMLVQAKLLDDNELNYSHIDYCIGNSGVLQIDRLLEISQKSEVPAILAFYNHLRDARRVPDVCCLHRCAECWGCSVALADAVKAALPRKDFETIKHHSMPWMCLLCCSRATDAPSRALAALSDLLEMSRNVFRKQDTPFEDVFDLPKHPSERPPPYFEKLSNLTDEVSPSIRQEILRKIAAESPGIDGIALITDPSDDEESF